jgi:RND family efflux transporter MFP subunit
MKKLFARLGRMALTGVLVAAAIVAGVELWNYYMNDPWTRDGRVSADVVGVAPDVSGLVRKVFVTDNQTVKAGDPLFEIDTSRFEVALEQAQAQLASAKATEAQAEREYQRYHDLNNSVVSRQKKEQVGTSLQTARAAVKLAQANVDLAKLNLDRTMVKASVDGRVTNFSLRPGNYVGAGKAVAALVDAHSYYIAGYFEETKLARIHLGDKVRVRLMGEDHEIAGHVASIAAGIQDSERTGANGSLANVRATFSWVRLAQRVPVRIALDDVPGSIELVAGRSATIHVIDPDGGNSRLVQDVKNTFD